MNRQASYPNDWGVPTHNQHYPGSAVLPTQNPPGPQQQFAMGFSSNPNYQCAEFQPQSVVAGNYRGSAAPALRSDHWQGSILPTNMQLPVTPESLELTDDPKRTCNLSKKPEKLRRQLLESRDTLHRTKVQLAQSEKNLRDLAAWALQERERLMKRQQELEAMVEELQDAESKDGRLPAAGLGSCRDQSMPWAQQGFNNARGQLGLPQLERLPGKEKGSSNSLQVAHGNHPYGDRPFQGNANRPKRKNDQPTRKMNQYQDTAIQVNQYHDSTIKSEDFEMPRTGMEVFNQANTSYIPTAPAAESHRSIVDGVNHLLAGELFRPTHREKY